MDDLTRESERPDIGACYKQCSTAREASIKIAKTDIDLNGHLKNNGLGGYTSIGRFDCTEDKDVLNTFHGVRFTKGQQTVNECISLSFDPATLTCTTCKNKHSITPPDGRPLTIVVSDQNFVSSITASDSSTCIPVVRFLRKCHSIWSSWPRARDFLHLQNQCREPFHGG